MILLAIRIAAGALLVAPVIAAAQTQPGPAEWSSERALELVQRAQDRRAEAAADTGLINYQARATGRVYFYLDREDTGERNLVKTDQLALDVIWEAPNLVKQRIVGWRDERALPTNIHYHLDHLSVVQENFGDEIRIGDGDEVRGVVHPAAPGAERFYEYRLADSLTLTLPGAEEPVRVYQLDVRPRDTSRPGFVGEVFVERRRGDIVRMDFTFTAAAYVDRYLDYINISLDNGLWRGRYWLPNEQRVELRRRIPQLDIPAGSVIRANMRIEEYVFNEALPPGTFGGPPVVALPREQREAFPFDEPIDAELREEGLGPGMELDEIRTEARRLVREQALRRLARAGLAAERFSDVLRYNRAEGLAIGAGVAVRSAPTMKLSGLLGYAFAAEHPFARARLTLGDRTLVRLEAYFNRVEDIGIEPAASGLMNSLSAVLAGRDYTDPYYASGFSGTISRRFANRWTTSGSVAVEQQESATLEAELSAFGGEFREVRQAEPVDAVVIGGLSIARSRPAEKADGWSGRASLEVGNWVVATGERRRWLEPGWDVDWRRMWRPAAMSLEISAAGGALVGDPPRQKAYLLGGRRSVPGFAFRSFSGNRFMMGGAVASTELAAPWLRGRALAHVGWSGGSTGFAEPTGSPKASVGLGVSLVYDILRVDFVRGLGPFGRWELIVDAAPSFWDFL